MSAAPDYWPEPRETANSQRLTGYLAGALEASAGAAGCFYRVAALGAPLEIENIATGNRYAVTVRQIAGNE